MSTTIEELEERVKKLESKSGSEKVLTKQFSSVGNISSDFLIKTHGNVKIQVNRKFIDLVKGGVLAVDTGCIYEADEVGTSDGIYVIGEGDDVSVVLKVGDQEITLVGEVGTTYVSFVGEQETTAEMKYQALTNIGFIYATLDDVDADALQNGIIYVESTQKLYIVENGVLTEYTVEFPNPYTEQFVIAKDDDSEGALVIEGDGEENSIIMGDTFMIYVDDDDTYFNSDGNYYFQIGDKTYVTISKNSVTFENDVISNYFGSVDASSTYGFRLYMLNGESYLEVDNLIVRNSDEDEEEEEDEDMCHPYPTWWFYDNNAIDSCTATTGWTATESDDDEEEDEDDEEEEETDPTLANDATSYTLALQYANSFSPADILYAYIVQDNDFKIVAFQVTGTTIQYDTDGYEFTIYQSDSGTYALAYGEYLYFSEVQTDDDGNEYLAFVLDSDDWEETSKSTVTIDDEEYDLVDSYTIKAADDSGYSFDGYIEIIIGDDVIRFTIDSDVETKDCVVCTLLTSLDITAVELAEQLQDIWIFKVARGQEVDSDGNLLFYDSDGNVITQVVETNEDTGETTTYYQDAEGNTVTVFIEGTDDTGATTYQDESGNTITQVTETDEETGETVTYYQDANGNTVEGVAISSAITDQAILSVGQNIDVKYSATTDEVSDQTNSLVRIGVLDTLGKNRVTNVPIEDETESTEETDTTLMGADDESTDTEDTESTEEEESDTEVVLEPITGVGIYANEIIAYEAQYEDGYILLEDDDTSRFASTEWVNFKLKTLVEWEGLITEETEDSYIIGTLTINGDENIIYGVDSGSDVTWKGLYTALTGTSIGTLTVDENNFTIYAPLSDVSWDGEYDSGVLIGTLTINGDDYNIYSPVAEEVEAGDTVSWDGEYDSGTLLGTLTINGDDNEIYTKPAFTKVVNYTDVGNLTSLEATDSKNTIIFATDDDIVKISSTSSQITNSQGIVFGFSVDTDEIKSLIEVDAEYEEGTKIATINGVEIYCPESSGSGDSHWYLSGSSLFASDDSTTAEYAAYATNFYTQSDERLKENIQNISIDDIYKIENVELKQFNFKKGNTEKKYGVIAQQVEQVGLNNLVSTSNNGYKSVDYTSLLILEILYLRQRNIELENRLNRIEQLLNI